MKKSISILIPIYNTPIKYLNHCFKSIKKQTFQGNMELVLINDGSNDQVKNYLENITFDNRFTIILEHNKENYGLAKSLNIGLNLCSNELIARMDSDDIMVSDRLDLQYNYFMKNPNVDILGGGMKVFPIKYRKIYNSFPLKINPKWIVNNCVQHFINHPSIMYKKSCIQELKGYNENLKCNYNEKTKKMEYESEDYDLWIRALINKKIIHNIRKILVMYRSHPNQLTQSFTDNAKNKRLEILNKLKESL
jgi:glycosyltransferase involved in cell wall biosynthesis